eukprot:2865334-Alexandrium_andersonii.AAC.1
MLGAHPRCTLGRSGLRAGDRPSPVPAGWGGLALRSASRMAPAAFWASWADCLSQVHARLPTACDRLLGELARGADSGAASVRAVADAALTLQREDFEPPGRQQFRAADFRAPQPAGREAGEREHGWQRHACVARDNHFATH